jgi:SRSO17 transposase
MAGNSPKPGRPVLFGVQYLLDRARWDAEAVRDNVRNYVIEYPVKPDAVLLADEAGFIKKGRHSVGM